MKEITSVQNSYIKHLLQLQEKAKVRRQTQTFLIEGLRELELAHKSNYVFETILWCSEIFKNDNLPHFLSNIPTIKINKEVYQKLAYRDTTEGIIAIAKAKSHSLEELKLKNNSLVLVAESIEKPGNIGALLRTADAANIDALILADAKTDIYNPNIIRSSVGGIFTVAIGMASSEEIIEFLNSNNVTIYNTTLQDSTAYYTQNFKESSAIVVGTEATGLTEIWRKNGKNINIPMQGKLDSMNVSVAAAIVLFEAKRQRGFL